MGIFCRTSKTQCSSTPAQQPAAPILHEVAIKGGYDRDSTRKAIANRTTDASVFDAVPSSSGEAAQLQRATPQSMKGQTELDIASTDLLRPEVHQETRAEWVACGRRRVQLQNVTRCVEYKRYESQSVVIEGDISKHTTIKVGSQDRAYLNASGMKGDKTIDLVKTDNRLSTGKLAVILDGKKLSDTTLKDGVATMRFTNGESLVVRGVKEGSDILVAADTTAAKAGKFIDVALLAERMPAARPTIPYDEPVKEATPPPVAAKPLDRSVQPPNLPAKPEDPFADPFAEPGLQPKAKEVEDSRAKEIENLKGQLALKDKEISTLKDEVKGLKKDLEEIKSLLKAQKESQGPGAAPLPKGTRPGLSSDSPPVEQKSDLSGVISTLTAAGYTPDTKNYPGFYVKNNSLVGTRHFTHPSSKEEFVMMPGNGESHRVHRIVNGAVSDAVQIVDKHGYGSLVMTKGRYNHSDGKWVPYDEAFMQGQNFEANFLHGHPIFHKKHEGRTLTYIPQSGKFYLLEYEGVQVSRAIESTLNGQNVKEVWSTSNQSPSSWSGIKGKWTTGKDAIDE